MQVALKLRALDGIEDASLVMGTQPNKEMLADARLFTPDGEDAGPNDLIIAFSGTEDGVEAAKDQLELLLRAELPSHGEQAEREPHTLVEGIGLLPDANLVLISTPGLYAPAEARKALQQGRHVMIFSDNVSIKDEYSLKKLASERGLLLMGADCGTAIIGGVPLGFANAIRRGNIGVVGASGTGMQEITTLIHRYGGGISHAIGTGSRDLSQRIGGVMTIAGLAALAADPQTDVIVVVSKPPHPTSAARVLEEAQRISKPIIVAFLGAAMDAGGSKIVAAETLEDAAQRAVELAGGTFSPEDGVGSEEMRDAARQLSPEQRFVRGLFSGGTFCYEAMLILQQALGPVYSNTPLAPEFSLADPHRSREHTCLDLGSDEFTVGRPHPMIDLTARSERILEEAADPQVAVLLLDVVLGYGAHPNPAAELAGAIGEARSLAADAGRTLPVVAHICGTSSDPQGLEAQQRALTDVGAILASSNAAAARWAVAIANRVTTNLV